MWEAHAQLHWQENKWVDALRKCALSMAAVAAVSAPLSFAPQEVHARPAWLKHLVRLLHRCVCRPDGAACCLRFCVLDFYSLAFLSLLYTALTHVTACSSCREQTRC